MGKQFFGNMVTNKSGGAGDQYFHLFTIIILCPILELRVLKLLILTISYEFVRIIVRYFIHIRYGAAT